jgi:transglutaminase-like putative cysteine protease
VQIEIEHITTYRFSTPQARLLQMMRVTPQSGGGQTVLDWSIDIDVDARLRTTTDGYGNIVTMLYVDGPISTIEIAKRGTVLTEDRGGIFTPTTETLPPAAYLASTSQTEASPAIVALADLVARRNPGQIMLLHALMTSIDARTRFDAGEGDANRTAAAAFEEGHGVCQDFAHIFCAAARHLHIPARYISGQLVQRNGEPQMQTASHAWAEAWIPELGWVGFDVANGICPDDSYVRVAIGLDYAAAAPLSGARTGGGAESMNVTVAVREANQ